MSIPLSCGCGRSLRVKDDLAGKRIRCPQCNGVLTVPAPESDVVDDMIVDEPPRPAGGLASRQPTGFRRAQDTPRVPTVQVADDRDDEPRPRRPKRRRSRRSSGGGGFSLPSISISPGIIGGAMMMLIAVVWFVLGLFLGWIFFYPPILFIIGLVRFVLSLLGQED